MKQTIQQVFLFSIVRHLLSLLAGMLVAWGWIDADVANEWTAQTAFTVTAGVASFILPLWLSYRDKIREFVEKRIALLLPPNSSLNEVASIARAVDDPKAVAAGDVEDIELPQGGKLTKK